MEHILSMVRKSSDKKDKKFLAILDFSLGGHSRGYGFKQILVSNFIKSSIGLRNNRDRNGIPISTHSKAYSIISISEPTSVLRMFLDKEYTIDKSFLDMIIILSLQRIRIIKKRTPNILKRTVSP